MIVPVTASKMWLLYSARRIEKVTSLTSRYHGIYADEANMKHRTIAQSTGCMIALNR